jgi:hypothetical protein
MNHHICANESVFFLFAACMVMACSASEAALPVDRVSAAESLLTVNNFPYQTTTLTNTNSALQNYATACVTVCPGQDVVFTACNDVSTGNPFFRLFLGTVQVAQNDDFCSLNPQITYYAASDGVCEDYCLHIGCSGSTSCSAYVEYSVQNSGPPSSAPSVFVPIVYTFPVQTPEMTNTNDAQQNYVTVCFTACPMQTLLFTTCNDTALQTGDPYLRLFLGGEQLAENDDTCGVFPQISYVVPTEGICQDDYCLHIGCYDTTSCSAYVEFTAQDAEPPTSAPSSVPTLGNAFPVQTPVMSDTNNALQNTTISCVYACAYQQLQFTTCGGQGTTNGDPLLRLYLGDLEVAANDNFCGDFPRIAYNVSAGEPCQEYCLHIGCSGSTSCSANVEFAVQQLPQPIVYTFPVTTPTMTNTNNALQNYISACVTACPLETMYFTTCQSPAYYSQVGDGYFRLYQGDVQVAENDNTCYLSPAVGYEVPADQPCQEYCLHIGCAGASSCLVVADYLPLYYHNPTVLPTVAPDYEFPVQSPKMTDTNNAQQNEAVACITACPYQQLQFSACSGLGYNTGNPMIRLDNQYTGQEVAVSNDFCGVLPQLYYKVTDYGFCQEFCLHIGCYESETCSVYVDYTVLNPDLFPFQSNVMSNSDDAQYIYQTACLEACPLQQLQFSTCGGGGSTTGDPYLRLFLGDTQIAESDNFCGNNPELTYTVPADQPCQTYCLHIGCAGYGTCSSYVEFFDTQPTSMPSTQPSSKPTAPSANPTPLPTAVPTETPSAVPTSAPTVLPTAQPTVVPSASPSLPPTPPPSAKPTIAPSATPTRPPTPAPSAKPTRAPSAVPTCRPTVAPTAKPTRAPTASPGRSPSAAPTVQPTAPTPDPTACPTAKPSAAPTVRPTAAPSARPTAPTQDPTALPTTDPSAGPTFQPSAPSCKPTVAPTDVISAQSDSSGGGGTLSSS